MGRLFNIKSDFVVGVGSSAGGMDALRKFFSQLGVCQNAAFIVLQHVSDRYESYTKDLLKAYTDMPIEVLEKDDLALLPGHIYIKVTKKALCFKKNKVICLEEPQQDDEYNFPIDTDLHLIAECFKDRSVGIILSGHGTDGTRGLQYIDRAGGMYFIQSPESAIQSDMPNTALTLLNTTTTYAPEDIGQQLHHYLQNPDGFKQQQFDKEHRHPITKIEADANAPDADYSESQTADDDSTLIRRVVSSSPQNIQPNNSDQLSDAGEDPEPDSILSREENSFLVDRIVEVLSEFTEVDISFYKRNTILRRIEKRLNINNLASLEEYYSLLQRNPAEMNLLFREFLINVTDFFRNPLAFQHLQQHIIPALCNAKKPMQVLRIWVVACATGEEAYSIAMLLEEYIQEHGLKLDYKIFASDLNEEAVNFASVGRYNNLPISSYFSPLFYKYFDKKDGVYEIRKALRKKIIFSRHNIIKDPPFIKLDLVSCRNLFIYLKPKVQEKLIYNFHYALNKGGYLFLGSNEYLPELKKRFTEASTPHRIFQVKEKLDHNTYNRLRANDYWFASSQSGNGSVQHSGLPAVKLPPSPEQDPYLEVLALQYAPPSVFVNSEGEVLYIHGEADRYLRLPHKHRNLNIFNMTDGSLNLVIRNGLRKVKSVKETQLYENVQFEKHGQLLSVNVSLIPLTQDLAQDRILIELRAGKQPLAEGNAAQSTFDSSQSERLKKLQHELTLTREELESTVNQLELSNQELQASNEEFMAANEEMQSTNEELQSANEELYTVNTELQEKIQELTVLYNDQDNLFASIDIGTVFLDAELRIRKFTPPIKENFNLNDGDMGRPIEHFTNNFNDDSILEDIRQAFRKLKPVEKTLQNNNGKFYLARIFPYKTSDNRIDGVILTLVDITALENARLKETELRQILQHKKDELLASEASYISLVKNIPDQIDRFDRGLRYVYANRVEGKLEPEDILGRTLHDVNPFGNLNTVNHLEQGLEEVFATGQEKTIHLTFGEGVNFCAYETIIVPERLPDGNFDRVLAISRDITEKQRYENQLLHTNWTIKSLLNNIPDIIVRFDIDHNCTFISQSISNHVAVKPESLLEKNLTELKAKDPLINQLRKTISSVCNTKHKTELDIEYPTDDGLKHFRVQFIPEFYSDTQEVVSVLTIASDFTRQKEKELEIQIKNQELKSINDYLDNFVYTVAHDLRAPVGNLKMVMEFLEKAKTDEDRLELINKLSRLSNRLDTTLSGLLQILETQFTQQSAQEKLAFGSILNFVKEEHSEHIEKAKATIIEDFAEVKHINYIEGYLQSIFRNLLSNALKYRSQERDTTISFKSTKVDNFIKLTIEDNGMGFDKEEVGDNLFKPFKRFTNKASGKGIGLHIVKTMIEKNGGRIEVDSRVDKGTIFHLYLKPYRRFKDETSKPLSQNIG